MMVFTCCILRLFEAGDDFVCLLAEAVQKNAELGFVEIFEH